MIAFAIMGAVNWITKWFDPAGPATSDQIGDAFADYLVGGLRKQDGPSPRTRQATARRDPRDTALSRVSVWTRIVYVRVNRRCARLS